VLLIPCIDLRAGRCVRLRQGDFGAETQYPTDPMHLAERYRALGATWLHVVDLDGARNGAAANTPTILSLTQRGGLRLQVGGGVRSPAVVESLLTAGVARVVIGSAAIERPNEVSEWLRAFGAERVCVALDVRRDAMGEPIVRTHGWTRNSALTLWDAVAAFPRGAVKHILCTDIERDGTLEGPSLQLYAAIRGRFPEFAWQASGGISRGSDLIALKRLGLAAALSGVALLEQRISSEEMQPFWPDASSPALT
jgi:phosphoribosylformimino-5-aminoimidazole carboxamide ribotide isomerase